MCKFKDQFSNFYNHQKELYSDYFESIHNFGMCYYFKNVKSLNMGCIFICLDLHFLSMCLEFF